MAKTLSMEVVSQGEKSSSVDPRRWLILAVLLLTTFLGTLDTDIVNVAIPSMKNNLHASFTEIQLVIAGDILAFAVVLATGGRLGDLYGRKRLLLLGVTGFTFCSACCGFAPIATWLIVFRVLQGGMAAFMLPQVVSLLNVSFLPEERGRAFSSYVVTIGLASIMGQVLGGLLLAANIVGLNWRSVFLVNIPIGLVALMAAWFLVHESRVPSTRRLDVGGGVLLCVALFLLIYPLTKGSSQSWSFWSILSLVAMCLLAVFLHYEQRLPLREGVPLVPLSLFKSRSFVAGVLSIFLIQLLFAAILLTLAFYLQDGLQYLPWQSGLVVMVMGIAFLLASSVSAHVGRRLGTRALHLGAALVTLGYVVALLAAQVFVPLYGIVPLLVGLFVISSGNGTLSPLVMNTALSEIDGSMAGAASGVYSTIQQVANALGVALIGTVFAVLLAHHASQTQSFVLLLLVSALVSAGLSFTAFLFPKQGKISR